MSTSIRLVYSKNSFDDQWPFYINFNELHRNVYQVQQAGIKIYCTPEVDRLWSASILFYNSYDSLLTLDFQYYFETDELFKENKNIAYEYIPIWKNLFSPEELTEYHRTHHITISTEEIINPDLSNYVLCPTMSAEDHGFSAI